MISIVCVLHEPISVQGRQGPLIGKDDRTLVTFYIVLFISAWIFLLHAVLTHSPSRMVKLSLITLARGARQFVVQEALDTTGREHKDIYTQHPVKVT